MSDIEKNNVEDDINLILESIISGEELDNSDNLLETINNSNQNFSNINIQLENIIDKYSSVGDIAFGYIANALRSSAADHILSIAEDIYDTNLKKYQSEINAELTNKNFDDDKYAPIAHNHDEVYKPLQTPVTEPADDTRPATSFINSITQDANGVISAAKKTVPTMTGATASSNGLIGLVPAPTLRDTTSFLRGDGTWALPANATMSADGFMSSADKTKLDGIEEGANNYSLPTASSSILGGIKVGTGLSINSSTGVLSHSTSAGYKHIPSGGSSGQYLKYSSSGTATWATPANATTSAAGFMSAEDKTKLDDSFRKCTMNVELSGSECNVYPIEFNVDNGESTSAPKIGEKFRVKIVNNSSTNPNIFMCAETLQLKINDNGYYIKFYSDYDLAYDLSGVTYNNKSLLTKFPTNGYIEFGIFKTTRATITESPTSSITTTVYCAFLISNSYAGSISNISYASIRTDQLNIYNAPSDLVSTYYLPVLQRGATGTDSSNATPHRVWTDSTYYLSYDTSRETVTSLNSPSFISSGASSFGSNTNVKSTFNIKGSNHNSDVITLAGNTSTAAPYISIKTAGSTTEGIRLTGRTSSGAASIKIVGSSTDKYTTITGGSNPSTTSDERFKNFKDDINIDFDELKNIPKKRFTWKDDDSQKISIGTSAQAVEKLYPELVSEYDGVKSLDYSTLSIIALAAIDKLNERITELENKLKEYEQ